MALPIAHGTTQVLFAHWNFVTPNLLASRHAAIAAMVAAAAATAAPAAGHTQASSLANKLVRPVLLPLKFLTNALRVHKRDDLLPRQVATVQLHRRFFCFGTEQLN